MLLFSEVRALCCAAAPELPAVSRRLRLLHSCLRGKPRDLPSRPCTLWHHLKSWSPRVPRLRASMPGLS